MSTLLKTFAVACAIAFLAIVPGAAQQPPGYGAPLTLEQAKKAMAAAEAEAVKNNLAMVVVIIDSTGSLQMVHRMDNAGLGSVQVAIGKAKTSLDFRQPTKNFQDRLAAGGGELRILTLQGVVAIEGGLPIVVGGKIVGPIGVSGGSPTQDGQVAKAGIDAIR